MPTLEEYISSILTQVVQIRNFLKDNPNVNNSVYDSLRSIDNDCSELLEQLENGDF